MADERREAHRGGGKVSPRAREGRIVELARNRHRVVTVSELLRIGLSRREIDGRVADSRLVRRYRGVYAVGPGALSAEGELLAAALFAGPDAVVSHDYAACQWRFVRGVAGLIDVTCPRRVAAPPRIRAHRSALPPDERALRNRVPVTSTGRTILDCAGRMDVRGVERMLNEAYVLGVPMKPPLAVLLDRHPRRAGNATVRAALERFEGGRTLTCSELEERFFDFLERHGLPRPLTNHPIETGIGVLVVDCAWPEARVAIEVDAPSTHGSRPKLLRDRRRDRALTLAGWTPGRIMEEDLEDEPGLAAEIVALLAARHGHRRPAP